MYQGGKVYVRRPEVDGWTAGTVIKVGPRNLYRVQNSDNSKVIRLCPKSELKPLTIQLSEAYKEGTPVMYYDHEKERWMHGTLLGSTVGLGKVQFLSQRARGEVILWFEEKDIRDSYPMSDGQSSSSSEALHTLVSDRSGVKKNALYQESEEDENVELDDDTSLRTAPEANRPPYSPSHHMGLPQSASWSYYPNWDTLTHPFFSIPFTAPPGASFPNAYELNANYTKTRHRTQQQQRPARTKLTSRGIPAHPSSHFFKNSQLSADPFMKNYQATQAAMFTQLLGYQYQLAGLAPWLAAASSFMMNPPPMPPPSHMAPPTHMPPPSHMAPPTHMPPPSYMAPRPRPPQFPSAYSTMHSIQLAGTMGHVGGWGNLPHPSQPPRSTQQAMRKAQTSLRPEKVPAGRPFSATGRSWGVPPLPKQPIALGDTSEEEEEVSKAAQAQPSNVEKKRRSRPASRPGSASKTQSKSTLGSKKQLEDLPSSSPAVIAQRPPSAQSYSGKSPSKHNLKAAIRMAFSSIVQAFSVVGESPVIKNCSSDDMSATVGKSILISCTAQGDPPPSFTWRHHGSLISSDDPHYHFPSAGFLQIPVARESDSGYYTCTVMNVCGSVSRCFHVEVNYPEPEEEGSCSHLASVDHAQEEDGSTGALLDFKTRVTAEEVSHLTPKLQRASNDFPSSKEHSKQHTKAAKEVTIPKEVTFPSIPVYIPHSRSVPMEEGRYSDPEDDTSGVGTLGTNTLSSPMRSGDSNSNVSARRRESPSSIERRPRADSITTYLYGPDYGSKSQPDLSRDAGFEFHDGATPGVGKGEGRKADSQGSKEESKASGILLTGSNSSHSGSATTQVTSTSGQVTSRLLDTSVQRTPPKEPSSQSNSEAKNLLQDDSSAQGLLEGMTHPGIVISDEFGLCSVEVAEVVTSGIDDSGELQQERQELQVLQDQLEQQMKQLQHLEGQAQQKPEGNRREKSVGFFSKVWKRLTKSSKQETASRCNRNDVSSTAL